MKTFIVAVCIFACALASEQDAQVVRSAYEQNVAGGFQFGFETENGIFGEASAVLKDLGKDEKALEVTGSNSYKSPEGEIIQIRYVANENGFQPQGDHLPTPPAPQPIPEYIQRALVWAAAHPYVEPKKA